MELLTPPGRAGVAVLRVAPSERAAIVAIVAPSLRGRTEHARPPVCRVRLELDGRLLDDALLIDRGPRGLELHVHGSPSVLATLRQHLGWSRSVPRSPAEQLLLHAVCVAQLDLALEQTGFDFAQCLRDLSALPRAERNTARAAAIARSRLAMAMTHPRRLVLVGRQNAGKSTLFNRLVGRERVLTGSMPGLTRDPVHEFTTLAGYPYELVDTAGEGAGLAGIDAAAVAAGRAQRDGACTVLVVDGSHEPTAMDMHLAANCDLVVAAKADLPPARSLARLPVAARVAAKVEDATWVRTVFGEILRRYRGLPEAGPAGGFAALTAEQLALLAGGD